VSPDELEVVDVEDELALLPELQAAANRAIAPTPLRRKARLRATCHFAARCLPLHVKGPRIMEIVLPSAQEALVGRYFDYIQPLRVVVRPQESRPIKSA
jgi:hypothetical protein